MQVYHPTKTSVVVQGATYHADENGIFDIPEEPSIIQQGFVLAHAIVAKIAQDKQHAPQELTPAPAANLPVVNNKIASTALTSIGKTNEQ